MRDPSAVVELSYRGDVTTLSEARRDVRAWLSNWGADDDTLDRAALIVSELATNALQASPGRSYRVHVSRVDDHHAAISVRNAASSTVPPRQENWGPVDRSSLRGRGLAIVSALSEQVIVEDGRGEVVVTARIRLQTR